MTQHDGLAGAIAELAEPVPLAALAALFDLAPFGAWIAGAAGALSYMNPAAAELLELAPGDLTGQAAKLALLCDQNGRPLHAGDLPLSRALRGESAENVSFRLGRGDADDVYLGFSYGPTRDGGAYVRAGDRTAERQLERARDDFLAAVAHDLRSPLTSIRGSAQLARRWATRNAVEAELLEKCLANIETAAGRLNRMLQTLMDSARVERGGLVLQPAPTDLVSIVNDVVGIISWSRGDTASALKRRTNRSSALGTRRCWSGRWRTWSATRSSTAPTAGWSPSSAPSWTARRC